MFKKNMFINHIFKYSIISHQLSPCLQKNLCNPYKKDFYQHFIQYYNIKMSPSLAYKFKKGIQTGS